MRTDCIAVKPCPKGVFMEHNFNELLRTKAVLPPLTFRWLYQPCPLWRGRSQAVPPDGPVLVSIYETGSARRAPLYHGMSWDLVGLKPGEQDTDNNVAADGCPGRVLGAHNAPWVGMGLSPCCLGLAATPTVLSAATPQLDTGLMGRGMEVAASFLTWDS